MGANDLQSVINLDPNGIIGRIYVGYHLKLLHTKYTGFRSFGFRSLCMFIFEYSYMYSIQVAVFVQK